MFVRMYTACLMCRAIRRSSRTASARSCCLGVGCRSPARAGVVHRGIPRPCIARQRVAPKMNIVRKRSKTVKKITKTREDRTQPTDSVGSATTYIKMRYIAQWHGRRTDCLLRQRGRDEGLPLFFPSGGSMRRCSRRDERERASSVRAEGTAQRASTPNISKKRARMKDLG